MISITESFFSLPYNGSVSILSIYRKRRLVGRSISWHDSLDGPVEKSIEVPLRLSKDTLLRAVYWMGISIAGRGASRISKEASRQGSEYEHRLSRRYVFQSFNPE
ncbi:TPA_asm: hypothetical protein [ssRNA phage Gephyllon.4_4]|uniref:Uncharacterized protein n=2 Tax=unclassified Fiersviridae TaxID=2852980 RepID=A0A8S5KY06_9VIRU|nr:hypothetical protein QIK85_gp4 [ssRNA phage Gephyllon.4_4]QDH87349.1 MAG: hypothetical protein H4BulkLitter22333_000004 [Leviviridae sp.]DAD50152.1 TPA_asm: hypothetical protein [ssRNA phage Gephyllon.4_4]